MTASMQPNNTVSEQNDRRATVMPSPPAGGGAGARQAVPITALHTEVAERVRMGRSPETIDRYAEEMAGGTDLGEVVVFRDKDRTLRLADGLHRVEGAKKAGKTEILAQVFEGGEREAFLYAAGANLKHGLAPSTDDRKKVATLLLKDDEWGQWSNVQIGRKCGLSDKTVAKLRAELSSDAPRMRKRKVERNGTVYEMDTTGICKPIEQGSQEATSLPPEPALACSRPAEEPEFPPGRTPAVEPPPPLPAAVQPGPAPKSPNWEKDPIGPDYMIDSGLLFELNRSVLHPIGLALAVRDTPDGKKGFYFVDGRADPASLAFDPATYERAQAKLAKFMAEFGQSQMDKRSSRLGRARQ